MNVMDTFTDVSGGEVMHRTTSILGASFGCSNRFCVTQLFTIIFHSALLLTCLKTSFIYFRALFIGVKVQNLHVGKIVDAVVNSDQQ